MDYLLLGGFGLLGFFISSRKVLLDCGLVFRTVLDIDVISRKIKFAKNGDF